ncbi:MAG: GIY-YIG nuclease family protein [Patescibacteria group bacterium]|nr:GIY-YIG nuclease family protein [Patescibacteria group bacterium]
MPEETLDLLRYYVYVLFSLKDSGFYIGFTTNLKIRLIQHAKGQVTSTKNRIPLKLIHYEYFTNRHDALSREKYLKSGYGRRSLNKFLQNTIRTIITPHVTNYKPLS